MKAKLRFAYNGASGFSMWYIVNEQYKEEREKRETESEFYLKPSSHISVIIVSPGKTVVRNRPDMVLTAVGSPLQTHLMIALIAKPSVHNPCNIGRGNLQWNKCQPCGSNVRVLKRKKDKHFSGYYYPIIPCNALVIQWIMNFNHFNLLDLK